jgi:hypothetical protein
VTLDVMHGDQRLARAVGECLGEREPHQQGADQAGAARHADRVELVQADPGALECLADGGVDVAHVVAARELGDDAAVRGVHGVLAVHHRRQNLAAALHDGRGHVVTGRLDTENERHARP